MTDEEKQFFRENVDVLRTEINFWSQIGLGSNVDKHVNDLLDLQNEIQNE